MQLFRIAIIIFICFLFLGSAYSQSDTIQLKYKSYELPFGLTKKVPIEKPKVALVLSGGGARGIAQLGVLKALEREQINIDLIIGTSMGSIVGGFYCSGYSIQELDSILTTTNWEEILSTAEGTRTNLFIDQKVTEDKNLLTLRLDGFTPVLPKSVSNGNKILNYLNTLTLKAPIVTSDFDKLKIPFRAVCSDLKTGNPVIIDKGNLAEVMRASSSVTFLLEPVEIDSFDLADGGLVANIPVSIARQLGADIVIAVNTTSPLRDYEELEKPWYYADQVVSIPMRQIQEREIKLADFVITPDISFASTDFSHLDSIVQIGYNEALKSAAVIKKFIEDKYTINLRKNDCLFNNVKFENLDNSVFGSLVNGYNNNSVVLRSVLLDKLRQNYENNGFHSLLVFERQNNFTRFNIVDNEQKQISEIFINGIDLGQFSFESKSLSGFIGKKINPEALCQGGIEVLRGYRDRGAELKQIRNIKIDYNTGRVDFEISSGIIDTVIISGNLKTRDNVIRREIIIDQAEPFSIYELNRSFNNLLGTNLFDLTSACLTEYENKTSLKFKVKEKNSGLLRLGVRADNERNFQVAVDVRDDNFLGIANEIGASFAGGLRNQSLAFENKANRIFMTFLTYKLKFFYDSYDRNVYTDAPEISYQNWDRLNTGEYREIKYGVKLALGAQIEKLGSIYFEAGRYKGISSIIKGLIDREQDIDLFTFKIGALFDSRNKFPYATDGARMEVYYETSQKAIGGELSYSKIFMEYETYYAYFKNHVLIPRVKFGFGDATLPLSEQFSLGGQNSFFGLHEDDFIGRQIFQASLEYRFLLPLKIFFDTYFKARYDLGGCWTTPAAIRYVELRHGFGIGLSFDTPIGAASFSIGKGFFIRNDLLNKPLSFGPYIFYFELGYPL